MKCLKTDKTMFSKLSTVYTIIEDADVDLYVYKCGHCHTYHLTRQENTILFNPNIVHKRNESLRLMDEANRKKKEALRRCSNEMTRLKKIIKYMERTKVAPKRVRHSRTL
jgi:predicted phosphodiesterase